MALSRNMVRNVKYGDTAIFAVGMALLLMYYKAGYHKETSAKTDPMFGVLRFVCICARVKNSQSVIGL